MANEDNKLDNKPVGRKKEVTSLQIDMQRHIFISGITQSGKSYAMKAIFDSIPEDRKCIFYDYKHDPNHVAWIKKNHYPIKKSLGALKRYWSPLNKESHKLFSNKKISNKVIYQPPRPHGYVGAHDQLEEISNYVFNKGNITFFLDEAAPLMSATDIASSLYDCYIMGASRGVVMIAISQRPMGIHNVVISEAYTKILFRTLLKGDRDKIEGFTSEEIADQLQFLPNHVFLIVYADGTYNRCTLKYKETD